MRRSIISLYRYCTDNHLPDLLAEYSRDNPYPADEIGFKSTIGCKWICKHGHIEYESPYKRVRRGYCKICGKDCQGSFGQRYPELVPYWSEHNQKTAYEVSPRYSGMIVWECVRGHTWERTIAKQLLAISPCPHCRDEDNALFAVRPELLDEWDYEANEVEPETVSYMSNVQYHWVCSEGHRFTASPAERLRRNKGCRVFKSLLKKRPDIALEWHPAKNARRPDEVTPSSHKEAWFVCRSCGTEYISKIADRCRRKGPNCPHCR